MHQNKGPVYYGDYLQLDQLLNTQKPKSRENGQECHDETLFIIVHQVYELWFKQILHELDSSLSILKRPHIEEPELVLINSRFERIKKIQSLLLDQLNVIETMTPMDFLEFRDLLIPASGFQSVQFREIEIKLGLSEGHRAPMDRDFFIGRLSTGDQNKIKNISLEDSLFDLTQKWLERIPFTHSHNFNFKNEYFNTVIEILGEEKRLIDENMANLSVNQLKLQLENHLLTEQTFQSLLHIEQHQLLIQSGERRLSHQATLSALFILLYRDEPILTAPFSYLTSLMDIDQNFTTWRHRHALMAQRMLGTKIGTGGSSGHAYLKRAADNNRIFNDLFNLSTFLIPRSKLPKLPHELKQQLQFGKR